MTLSEKRHFFCLITIAEISHIRSSHISVYLSVRGFITCGSFREVYKDVTETITILKSDGKNKSLILKLLAIDSKIVFAL
jgi:hypothetical protein